jgi:hypothetical protein
MINTGAQCFTMLQQTKFDLTQFGATVSDCYSARATPMCCCSILVRMYNNPWLQFVPLPLATVLSPHSVSSAHLAHLGCYNHPLRIRCPRRIPDRLTLSRHLIQDPPLLATFVCFRASACVMPCRVHDGPTRMHTSCPRI